MTIILSSSCSGRQSTEQTIPEFEDEQLGQLIMIGFRGNELTPGDPVRDHIISYNPGGFVLFDYDVQLKKYGRNITSAKQLMTLTDTLKKLSSDLPFIAVDQEGGKVNRLKPRYGFPESRSAQYLGITDREDSTRFYAGRTAALLSETGINVNFAPVTDLNVNPANPVIGGYERSYSKEASVVVRHARFVVSEQSQAGIVSVLKHFPGHGSSRNDSHEGFTDVTDSWSMEELIPYRELIGKHEKLAVMTAHIYNRNLDPDWPATLSPVTIGGLLRDSLGFNGVIFSDDMQMGAITENYGLKTAIRQAILSGVDVLIFGNNLVYEQDILPRSIEIIKELLESGEITSEHVQSSLDRIHQLKQKLTEQ